MTSSSTIWAALLFLWTFIGSKLAQGSGVDYSASWDFTNAGSKLDVLTQAEASPYFSLFNSKFQRQPVMVAATLLVSD